MRSTSQKPAEDRLAALIGGYAPLPGIPDEFIGPGGRPRPHWLQFLEALTDLPEAEIGSRFAAADRHIRDTGLSYRAYGESSERSWPLSHVPLLIGAGEWRHIEAGVAQRARLLELTLADLYGPGKLVSEGIVPAAAVTGSLDFLHAMHGVRPAGGRFLQVYAADLGRGPDGRWWVLGDRTQAPSGSGYALANRLVLSRAFPALYSTMNVERLAPFFQHFRAGLAAGSKRDAPRICLLSSGPLSETYFEQAYLARYLGLTLVEGGDLSMQDGRVFVRTIAGIKRADVLWRRIDSDFADPLELNARSRLGVPGLVEAVRAGGVAVANALGSGVPEAAAFMSFMPSIARHFGEEELLLPNIATWWCGQRRARAAVLADLGDMAIAGAFGNAVLGHPAGQAVAGARLDAAARARLAAQIGERGVDFVGQEVVHLSTTPIFIDGRLEPRPFVLRVFAAATPEGWKILPGGFARISGQRDARAVSMGEGVQSADVWVIADRPVAMSSLLPAADDVRIRRIMGNLPSRAADNLFWLGRYLERCEAALRLVRCLAGRLLDTDGLREAATLASLKGLIGAGGAAPFKLARSMPPLRLAATALHSKDSYGSAFCLAQEARRTAFSIRERLSLDIWRLVGGLCARLGADSAADLSEAEAYETADSGLRTLAAISGLAQENMNRVAGWRFLEMGRRIERAIGTCRLARTFAQATSSASDLDILLDLVDSQITYRMRYLTGVALAPIRDMVMLDGFNPRSVAFQVARAGEHLDSLPLLDNDGMPEAPRRLLATIAAHLAAADARFVDTREILALEQRLLALADAVAGRYFLQGPHAIRADNGSELG